MVIYYFPPEVSLIINHYTMSEQAQAVLNPYLSWGTSITDHRLAILQRGVWSGFKVIKHTRLRNGEVKSDPFFSGSCFIDGDKLYMTMGGSFTNAITGFFELTTDQTDKSYMEYYEVVKDLV